MLFQLWRFTGAERSVCSLLWLQRLTCASRVYPGVALSVTRFVHFASNVSGPRKSWLSGRTFQLRQSSGLNEVTPEWRRFSPLWMYSHPKFALVSPKLRVGAKEHETFDSRRPRYGSELSTCLAMLILILAAISLAQFKPTQPSLKRMMG